MFVLFVTLILLWLFREPKFIPGWGSVFSTDDDGRRYACTPVYTVFSILGHRIIIFSYFSDTSTVLFVVFLLFVMPSQPFYSCSSKPFSLFYHMNRLYHLSVERKFAWLESGSSPRLLDWNTVQHKLPWDVVILLGSGFALAAGAQVR